MKKLLAATFVALLLVGCGEDSKKPGGDSLESNQSSAETPTAKSPEVAKVVVDDHQLQFRGDFAYFEGQRFTGVAVKKYPNGQKMNEGTHKDGKWHGLWTEWYENGQKKWEETWKDGNLVTATVWKPNGEKCPDTNVVNGNGIMCWYHDNGQKRGEATFKDGKLVTL